MKRILLLFAILLGISAAFASGTNGNIKVSVLTCSPGQEVYSLYGHTAIRVQDKTMGTDHVFNYGVFDFNTEYFVWKFVLGHTDYICMAAPWEHFIAEYQHRGSSVVAQELNLTDSEALKVRDYLYNNIRKENCVYRYNFLTCNCTTRVMDCIESCIEGELVYSWNKEPLTYRDILHQYTKSFPWTQDGNDMLLGADVDTLLSHHATCFIPEYYQNALSGAVVRNEFQDTRQLVSQTQTLVKANPNAAKQETDLPLGPMEAGWVLFALGILTMSIEFLVRKMLWPLDIILMLLHGLAGCIITFLFFFSEHPAVDSNWLVGIINPLPLIILPYTTRAAWRGERTMWHYFMAVWLAIYLLFMPWMPQQMPLIIVPLLATLLSRQVSYILHYSRCNKASGQRKHKKARKNRK